MRLPLDTCGLLWELAVKAGLGRIDLPFADLQSTIEQAGFAELTVTIAHTLRVRDLPQHHRDPFDRLLVAQAVDEALTLVSGDHAIRSYPVQTLWA
ncbi:MAG: type II toxin-antitoxin system VapC family toxin [Kiloniellales bacterium]